MHHKYYFFIFVVCLIGLVSCGDESSSDFEIPETYTFLRDGNSTVSFSGQTTRIRMAEELISALKDNNSLESNLLGMYRNTDEGGNNIDPFVLAELNESTKSIKSKVADSKDFFSTNTVEASIIKNQFEQWINDQVNEVFPSYEVLASPGVAGQILDGSSVRYVNSKGLEYDQAIGKGLIGALMADQLMNNYLSPSVLDEADNRANNDSDVTVEGKAYTNMEHKWDEAYGYLFGNSSSSEDPIQNLGEVDGFLNKYVGRVNGDEDFVGIGQEIFDAFKKGRAAIVAKEYDTRDEQADIIIEKISEVIGIRSVYYLQQGKNGLPTDPESTAFGPAFHDLSEGIGFIYSLRFTRKPGSNDSYFTREEVDGFLESLLDANVNGLWDIDTQTLDDISSSIADKFDFTVEQAAE
ncbi:MAG: DUF4856 domain-containing protein [Saprospiraceae bacterium]|nr:DUF4856 domain-containing protein [Saprospiraceae bacterium]